MMENHYRHLVAAVLVVVTLVVAGVGWTALRGGESRTEVTVPAAPRQVSIPAAAGASVAAPAKSSMPPVAPGVTGAPRPAPDTGAGDVRVHVAGAVRHAGVYALARGARVIDAIARAGGARADADLDAINLADFIRDGEQIRIPTRQRALRPAPVASGFSPRSRAVSLARPSAILAPGAPSPQRTLGRYPGRSLASDAVPPRPGGPINVNTAGAAELDELPGVGRVTAQAILDYRREHGPFQRPEDLLQVRGIGTKKLAKMMDRVTVR
jgi:competence protein ComEA